MRSHAWPAGNARMSLRFGILLTMLACIGITDLLATLAINARLADGARQEADHQARGRAVMTETLLDQHQATLSANAEAIAMYPAVIAAVEGRNAQPLAKWADEVAQRQGIHVKVFDAQGTALAHGHNAARLGPMDHQHDASQPDEPPPMLQGLQKALDGQRSSDVETSDEIGLALRGFAPVRTNGVDGDVVGAVMLADPLDDVLLSELVGGDASGVSLHLAQFEAASLRDQPYACRAASNAAVATCMVRLDAPDGARLDPHLVMSVSLLDVATARDEGQRAAGMAGVVLLAIGALVAWLLARWLTAPLERLTASARRFARGDYSPSLDASGGPSEVRVLARTLDKMRKRVARSTAALSDERDVLDAVLESAGSGIALVATNGKPVLRNRRWAEFAVPTLLRVGDGRPLEDAIQDWLTEPMRIGGADYERNGPAYARYRCYTAPVEHDDGRLFGRLFVLHDVTRDSEADRLRNAFMATMSHELRTPLAAISGYTSTLLTNGPWDAATQHEFLEIIESSARLLTRLVDNLLDAAALEAGALRLDTEPLRLDRVAEDVVVRLRPLGAGHALQINAAPDLPMADADPLRVEQIITNLVENAIKYSPDGGAITVSLAATGGGEVHVGVGDSGIGIPPDEVQHIFDRFYRGGNSGRRPKRGAGLGLFVCQRLVEAHGGRIWVTSTPGVGSIFHFTLPAIVDQSAVAREPALECVA